MALNAKTDWLAKRAVGKVLVVGTEDTDFWKSKGIVPFSALSTTEPGVAWDIVVLAEVLQKVDDPAVVLKLAKETAGKILITVPNERSWLPQFNPMKNPAHKRVYDTDMLANQLEEAGLVYILGIADFGGWSFITAEATMP